MVALCIPNIPSPYPVLLHWAIYKFVVVNFDALAQIFESIGDKLSSSAN